MAGATDRSQPTKIPIRAQGEKEAHFAACAVAYDDELSANLKKWMFCVSERRLLEWDAHLVVLTAWTEEDMALRRARWLVDRPSVGCDGRGRTAYSNAAGCREGGGRGVKGGRESVGT